MGTAEVVSALFSSAFPGQFSQASVAAGRTLEEKQQQWEGSSALTSDNLEQSVGAEGRYPRELSEQAAVTGRPLSILWERPWRLEELSQGWQHPPMARMAEG